MPRGDGTGPFGTGPLNKGGRRPGRGSGRRQGQNRSSDSADRDRKQDPAKLGFSGLSTGSILNTAVKLLGMAAMAIPAVLKARRQLQLSGADRRPEISDDGQPVIEITPESVEEKDPVKGRE